MSFKDTGKQDEKKISSRESWIAKAEELWNESARALSVSARYLFSALNRLDRRPDARFSYTATDGESIYYNPMKLSGRAMQGQVYINRTYMHMVLHCIFPAVRKAGLFSGRDREIWDIASDIHAEYILDGMQTPALMLPESDLKEAVYRSLTDKCGVLSVENIFAAIKNEKDDELARLSELFYTDDHLLWPQMKKDKQDEWERQSLALMSRLPAYGRGKGEERMLKSLRASAGREVSYEEFLKKFMRMREETRLDPDTFDYAYYNYGLTIYGDMPLIEEQETREERGLEELVIVIDTSGSCAGDAVKRFLEETIRLIADATHLSANVAIRLIQCDREVHSDVSIDPHTNVAALVDSMELKGGGGTDFRPAFAHVREHTAAGRRVSAMIYFTDGYGIYPVARPPWKTAFVFVKEPDFDDEERMRLAAAGLGDGRLAGALRPPDWALKHVL